MPQAGPGRGRPQVLADGTDLYNQPQHRPPQVGQPDDPGTTHLEQTGQRRGTVRNTIANVNPVISNQHEPRRDEGQDQ